jgi:5'-nucleotidase
VLGEMKTELDGRFSKVRSQETNLGNFICDVILAAVEADCCILNSGSLRSDTLHPAGVFRVRDLKAIVPFADSMSVVSVTGI